MEQELRESEDRYRAFFESSIDAVLITSSDGNVRWRLVNAQPAYDDQGNLLGAVASFFDITERKRMEEALRELNATLENKVAQRTAELKRRARQLQKMALDMSEAEDRERKRLAEVLHDDLQQVLAAAKFHLSLMRSGVREDPALHDIGEQIDQMLKDAIAKSRSLSHELSPAVLHKGDFKETLEWLANQVQAKHGLVVHVHTHDRVSLESDATKAFLYKVTQESLFNVVKHARVAEARIRLRRLDHWIFLSVSDRGRGFDVQELGQTPGFGLLSIRERIELLGGASNGREAVDLADRLQPNVVIMDVSMPLMSGDEATRQIKQNLPNTRVVALSMSEDPDAAQRMHAAGAEAYVLKTAPSEELLAAIRGD